MVIFEALSLRVQRSNHCPKMRLLRRPSFLAMTCVDGLPRFPRGKHARGIGAQTSVKDHLGWQQGASQFFQLGNDFTLCSPVQPDRGMSKSRLLERGDLIPRAEFPRCAEYNHIE